MPEKKIEITPAKGRPMLHWVAKKPLEYVKGFPAQLVEVFDPQNNAKISQIPSYENLRDNWHNLLFHGDNKDVLATLLELGFRGKVDLIYIDPPFSSNKDYVRKIELRGLRGLGRLEEDEASLLQQVMYEDMWKRDEYFQFMYERLLLLKELLAENGTIWVHLDENIGHYVKILMDEVFGYDNFINQIIWYYPDNFQGWIKKYSSNHNFVLAYGKTPNTPITRIKIPLEKPIKRDVRVWDKEKGKVVAARDKKGNIIYKTYTEKYEDDVWIIGQSSVSKAHSKEYLGFETQKPEELLRRIILSGSKSGDIVLDCFIGSGTAAAVAQKLNRRWIGVEINKGAVQLTSKRLQKIVLGQIKNNETEYPVFAIYKVNDYDLKLLKIEAIELAVQHIGIQRTRTDSFFDGSLGRNLVKIIDFNHPLTLLDLQLIQDEIKKRPNEDRDITVVCLGKELAVDAWIDEWNKKHPVNKIRVIELKTDTKYGGFLIHKPAEAKVKVKRTDKTKAKVLIENFISPTIIERLNLDSKLFKKKIPDFRSMVDTVLIDSNYDGKTFRVVFSDLPEKRDDLVKGEYEIEIPKSKAKIAVKIIDMLGEEVLVTEEV